MKRIAILFCTVVLFSGGLLAQDIHFSQFYMAPLHLNPALTGVMNCSNRVSVNYRNQWSSVLKSNAFNTYSLGYDQKIPVGRNDYFGIGGSLWGDRAGSLNFSTMQARLSGSYSKRMGGYRKKSHYLVVGAEAGVSQRSVDFVNATWGNQFNGTNIDPSLPSGETNLNNSNFLFADLAAGVMWYTVFDQNNNFYLGGAYSHLNRANQSFYDEKFEPLYSKFTVHAGGEFKLKQKLSMLPGVVMFKQGPSFQLNGGTSLRFQLGNSKYNDQSFQIGLWTRLANHFEKTFTHDAMIVSTRFDYNQFSLGFSYDVNVSKLKVASNGAGGFEFALQYKFCGNERRGVYCPDF